MDQLSRDGGAAPGGAATGGAATRGGVFHLIGTDATEAYRPADALGAIHAEARRLATRLPAGAAVGLLFRSGQELIQTWFACLHAGLRPLIMQYPTRKQSRAYWADSVTHTIAQAGLAGIIADEYCAERGLPTTVTLLRRADIAAPPVPDPGTLLPEDFTILQLSSGTTGYRKAMAFTAAALRQHAADYNQVLGLDPARDCLVSWLPLYHDMGYVACFVMPILLGIDVAMMDPMTWVEAPERLFAAIERHHGTLCYMPNFGFEVMLRAPARALPTMRHWISCSEPVSASTASRFCAHIGADPAHFAPCYAMAENLFAVTFGQGFETRVVDDAEVVSCGRPIPGVSVKTVDGEIWVRSAYSLHGYLGAEDIRDADGYYPTGDMGALRDGELYVSGRKGDVLIQAGRKFMLSDVDLKLNEAYPEVRGRAAALALRDEALGTETALILIEAPDFFDRRDGHEMAAKMIDLTGMDQIEVAFVPPRFLTKTSSGKINRRKTRDDWKLALAARDRQAGPRDPAAHLRATFPHIDATRPMGEVLDSLSATIVRIALEATPVAYDAKRSLNAVLADLDGLRGSVPATVTTREGIRIVSLADRIIVNGISEADLDRMGEALGCPVTLEHVCLPPSPVLFSDLVFHDWFQPRLPNQEDFAYVDQAMAKIKGASLLITDSIAELQLLYHSSYPVLSHALERDPRADLLCLRWANYGTNHHKLPLSVASGNEIPLTASNVTLDAMSRYLGTPIFRVTSRPGYEGVAGTWDHVLRDRLRGVGNNRDILVADLIDWIGRHPAVGRRLLAEGPRLQLSDPLHFCSVQARKSSVDAVLEHFDSFYIFGVQSSLVYARRRLDELGKPYVLLPSISQAAIDAVPEKYACMIVAGAFGNPPRHLPCVCFQEAGLGWRAQGIEAVEANPERLQWLNDYSKGGTDWFYLFPLRQSANHRMIWRQALRMRRMKGAAIDDGGELEAFEDG